MEDTALQDTEPAGGKLEIIAGDCGRMPAVPLTETAALRVPNLWDVQQPRGRQAEGRNVGKVA
jgi:hypothetical protein